MESTFKLFSINSPHLLGTLPRQTLDQKLKAVPDSLAKSFFPFSQLFEYLADENYMLLISLEELFRSLLPEPKNSELLESVFVTLIPEILSDISTTTTIPILTDTLASIEQANIQHMPLRNHFLLPK